jgi:hypothetical protein
MSRTTRKEVWKQRGMVSIMVTMLLMIVISLIVLGFAQISRRNQRQALDRQLSSQAFYAAETGVNEARNLLKDAIATGTAIPDKPDCTSGSGPAAAFYASLTPTIDAASDVAYTCLMVDASPEELGYDAVGTPSTIVPLTSTAGNIANLQLTWQTKDDTTTPTVGCPTSANNLPTTGAWTTSNCGYGVLRFDLVPTTGSLTMSTLQDRTMTAFLVPVPSSVTTSIPYPSTLPTSSTNTNNRVATRCTNTSCTMTITGLNSTQYYMRVSSLYKEVSLRIRATDSTGSAVGLQGVQAIIDATGKAQDVLRRVQVRVPLTGSSNNQLSDYAIQSTDAICKRYAVMDGYFQSYAATAVSGLTSITTPPNPLCL